MIKKEVSLFGLNLRKLRKEKNLTQDKLAKTLGFTRPNIGAYEEGRAEPPFKQVIKFCDYFNVTLDDLIRREL